PLIPEGAALPPSSLRTRVAGLVNPYNINEYLSLEQPSCKNLGRTLSWDGQRGIHLYRSRNINAPLPGIGVRPDPSQGNIYQLESTGLSKSNNFTIGMRNQMRGRIQGQMFASYTLGYTKNDRDGGIRLPGEATTQPRWTGIPTGQTKSRPAKMTTRISRSTIVRHLPRCAAHRWL